MTGRSFLLSSLRTAALALAFGMALLAPVRVQAQGIGESQKRLQDIRRERTELRQDLARLRTQVHDVSGELRNLTRQMETSGQAVRELDFQLSATEQAIDSTTRDLLATEVRLVEKRALLHRRLRDIYKRGPLATAQVLLAAESFGDLFNRYKYLSLVARQDRSLVEEVGHLQGQLSIRRIQLQRTLAEVQALRRERLDEQTNMQELEGQQRRTLSALETQERSTSARITQLAQDERQLTTLIATLERRRREAEARAARERAARERAARAAGAAPSPAAPRRAASTLSTSDLGSLGWPVDGRVIYRFGPARQPNGTTIRWNGIGIAAAAGTPVIAVEAGEVVLAAPFEGYGPTVVLSHGGGYYSLYLYLSQLGVQEGARVVRGQRLGAVGGEATPEGAHLEFQIRSPGGEATDPLVWLRNRSGR